MVDYPKNEFTLWFNCMPDQKKEGHYWAAAEIPVEELEKLYNWALHQNPVANDKGQPCVQLRANLRPRVSKSGNDYLLLAVSDQKPKAASPARMPF